MTVLPGSYAVCRLAPDSPVPAWIDQTGFTSISRSDEELSLVCLDRNIPADTVSQKNWRIIKVLGPLDFSLVGILASISRVLADQRISLFAVSTFDTDYILVQESSLDSAVQALRDAQVQFIHPE